MDGHHKHIAGQRAIRSAFESDGNPKAHQIRSTLYTAIINVQILLSYRL